MKRTILLLALSAAVLSSCTTAYKTGQTPDDVYYSPARPQDEYVRTEKRDDRQYQSNDEYYDDRYLRMKVHDRTRWSDLNDWYYYERYGIMGNYYYGTYNNPYNSWNYYYNPYCHNNAIAINSKYISVNNNPIRPRNFSLNAYTNNNYNNNNNRVYLKSTSKPAYNNSNGLSNTLKQIFTGGNNNSNSNSNSTPTRTYTPSTSSSSSSGSSSGSSGSSSGGVSRPVRN
jgi:hypothetical protein